MRRPPQARIPRQPRQRPRTRLPKADITLGRRPETHLPGAKRPPVTAAELVMHRQQREPDPRHRRGRGNPLCYLGRIGIRRPVRLVVQIMKLGSAGIARLKHLHLHEGRDRLDLIGRHLREIAEHEPPPGPEGVARVRPSRLGQPRHRALERMRMQVRRRGQQNCPPFAPGGRPRLDPRDPAIRTDRHSHIARPTIRQKRPLRPEHGHLDTPNMCRHNLIKTLA